MRETGNAVTSPPPPSLFPSFPPSLPSSPPPPALCISMKIKGGGKGRDHFNMNAVTLFSDDGCRQELTRSNLNRIAESIKSNRLSQTSLLMELGSFHSASGHTLSCLTPSAPSLEGFFSSSSLSFPGISMRGFCWILLPPPLPSPSPPPPPTGQELELIEAADQPRLSHKKSLDLGTDEHQLLQFPLSYPSNIPDNSDISDNSDPGT